MAHSDEAVGLDKSGLDITSGFCMCVFHRECMTGFLCKRCLAKGTGVKLVTGRCCLRCAVFSPDPLCPRCFFAFSDLVLSSLRLQDGIELEELALSFLPLNPPHTAIPWIMVQLMTRPALSFVIVEEKGSFIGRTRAWAVVELWRKMLNFQKRVDVNLHGNETDNVIVAALDLLPKKNMIVEEGRVRMLDRRAPVSDDGYYALGSTLCASGLLDDIMQRTHVDRYFVTSRNEFVFYSNRHSPAEADPNLLDQWQSAYAAICVKRITEQKE